MKTHSAEYDTLMARGIRNRGYCVIRFPNLQKAVSSFTEYASSGDDPHCDIYSVLAPTNPAFDHRGTLEMNRWVLNGTRFIPSPVAQGWVSDTPADDHGNCDCYISFSFNKRILQDFSMAFDYVTGEKPSAFKVDLYNDSLRVFTNNYTAADIGANTIFHMSDDISEYGEVNKVVITITKYVPLHQPRISGLQMLGEMIFNNDDIITCTTAHDVDPVSRRMPVESATFTIADYKKEFNPDNPYSNFKFNIGEIFTVQYGIEKDNGTIEYLNADTYQISEMPTVSNHEVTFNGMSRLGLMAADTTEYADAKVSSSIGDSRCDYKANLVCADYGLTSGVDYDISNANHLWGILPLDTHANCLLALAHCSASRLYTDENNCIHISSIDTTANPVATINFDSIIQQTMSFERTPKLRKMFIPIYIFDPSLTDEADLFRGLIYKDSDSTGEYRITWDDYSIGYITPQILGGSIVLDKEMIHGADVNITFNPGSNVVKVLLKSDVFGVETVDKTVIHNADGDEDTTEDSPLFAVNQTGNGNPGIFDIKDWIDKYSTYLDYTDTYSFDYRGNPEIETGDIINFQTDYSASLKGVVLCNSITFDGTFSGTLTVKVVG